MVTFSTFGVNVFLFYMQFHLDFSCCFHVLYTLQQCFLLLIDVSVHTAYFSFFMLKGVKVNNNSIVYRGQCTLLIHFNMYRSTSACDCCCFCCCCCCCCFLISQTHSSKIGDENFDMVRSKK